MFNKAGGCELTWDFTFADEVHDSQRWVLSAMQCHGRELVSMLWRILGNEQDVCDAYQNTFLQLAHYEAGQKPVHVKAYVFRTASNVAISMLRRSIAERKRLSEVKPSSKVTDSAEHELDFRQLQEILRANIAQLPENLRNVVLLHDLAELSYGQTGRALGISAGTARVYRCKAMGLLAVWMGKETDG